MKFLGVDLGWQSQPSGLCCLAWQAGSLDLLALACRPTHAEVLAWIDDHAPAQPLLEPAIVAVDAPILISNATGMRRADRQAHQLFGKYHAGCYPANLSRPFAQQTVGFGQSLTARGFCHAPSIQPQQPGRYQIEVFPHPAIVHLFGLPQILKYKKGRLADRRIALAHYRDLIVATLPRLEPSLNLNGQPALLAKLLAELPQTGLRLKALEDQLDSLICAYVAAHWWYWGTARNCVVGPEDSATCTVEGYIIVPQRY